jgi:HEAT repeat protein
MAGRHGWLLGLLLASVAQAQPPHPRLEGVACSWKGLLDDARKGLSRGSPALKKYLENHLQEVATGMSVDELSKAFVNEKDPAMLRVMGAALAAKASNEGDGSFIAPVLARASGDPDPRARAAAVSALRASGSPELMESAGGKVSYASLIRDASPEVRRAVVENLSAEDKEVYSGQHSVFTAKALEAATAAEDPSTKASLLSNLSLEAATNEGLASLLGELKSSNASVRAAAVKALGGAPSTESQAVTDSLLERYPKETNVAVKQALLEAVARLGQVRAIPTLRTLRGQDPRLARDIDLWISALSAGRQEWDLIVRERQRLASAP